MAKLNVAIAMLNAGYWPTEMLKTPIFGAVGYNSSSLIYLFFGLFAFFTPLLVNKIASTLLANLFREAQRVSRDEAEPPAKEPNAHLESIEGRPEFYTRVQALLAQYFDLFGEVEES